jgi:hypothetical protein
LIEADFGHKYQPKVIQNNQIDGTFRLCGLKEGETPRGYAAGERHPQARLTWAG